jgi:hypothetical protein
MGRTPSKGAVPADSLLAGRIYVTDVELPMVPCRTSQVSQASLEDDVAKIVRIPPNTPFLVQVVEPPEPGEFSCWYHCKAMIENEKGQWIPHTGYITANVLGKGAVRRDV